jgi:hypothetical protein
MPVVWKAAIVGVGVELYDCVGTIDMAQVRK